MSVEFHQLPIKKCSNCKKKSHIPSHTTLCIDCYWKPKDVTLLQESKA